MKELLSLIIFVVLAIVLLPVLGKLVLFLLGAAAIFFLIMYIRSRKVQEEIKIDPAAYFARQKAEKEKDGIRIHDAIDVEYTEREIKEDD